MLKNINQSDTRLLNAINKWGCYFLCLAEASPIVFKDKEGCMKLNGIWSKAIELGYITGDLNHDGDLDDDGEAEIQKPTELAQNLFDLKVKYDGIHHKGDELIPANVKVIIGQFWWQGGHFALINHLKKVIRDPYGQSNTVKNGYLKTMRWFYAV